jgi:hypothetical protein
MSRWPPRRLWPRGGYEREPRLASHGNDGAGKHDRFGAIRRKRGESSLWRPCPLGRRARSLGFPLGAQVAKTPYKPRLSLGYLGYLGYLGDFKKINEQRKKRLCARLSRRIAAGRQTRALAVVRPDLARGRRRRRCAGVSPGRCWRRRRDMSGLSKYRRSRAPWPVGRDRRRRRRRDPSPNLSRNGVSTVARQVRKAGLSIFGMATRRAVASERPCFGTGRPPRACA